VGEAPGLREDEVARPFSGKAGQLLDKLLAEAGLKREEVFITNTVKCRPPTNRTPTKTEIQECTPYLWKEVKRVKPRFMLLLGNTALEGVLGVKGIKKARGNWVEVGDIQILPTYHPAAVLRNPGLMPLIQSDLQKFALATKGQLSQENDISYVFINNREGLQKVLRDAEKAIKLSYDIETGGQDYQDVLCVGTYMRFKDGTEEGYFIPLAHPQAPKKFRKNWEKIFNALLVMLRKKKGRRTVGQNAKYDNKYWRRYSKDPYGSAPYLDFDLMLGSHLVDENSPHGLDYLSQTYANAPAYKNEVNKKALEKEDIYKVAKYNIQDCFYALHAADAVEEKLKEDSKLWSIFKYITMPGNRALEKAEIRGMYVHQDKLTEQIKIAKKHIAKTRKKMKKYLPKGTDICGCWNCRKFREEGEVCYCTADEEGWVEVSREDICEDWKQKGKRKGFNFNSSQQMAWLLFEHLGLEPVEYTKTKKPSTAEGTLAYLNHPFIDILLEYRKWQKLLSTYLIPWQRLSQKDGRIHTSFKQHGTVTGRLSSEKPNLQNVPRESDIRTIIGAPPGWKLVEADYSQIELRGAAHAANEQTMIRIYASGGDIHRETATVITGKRPEDITKDERKKAKAVNFGFLYGMGWKKFKQYAKEKYDIEFTDKECKTIRKRFFQKYKALKPWHDRQRRIVHKLGYVRSPIGRIRHLPDVFSQEESIVAEAERQSINSPIQAIPPDLTLLAVAELEKIPGFWEEIFLVCQVHDANLFEVREDVLDKWCPLIKKTMEELPLKELFDCEFTVPIVVDVKSGDCWGDKNAKEWKEVR